MKSSTKRHHAKYGMDKKGNQCPFKMWVLWINKEKYFQIEGFNDTHSCIRVFRYVILVNPNWIAKQFHTHLYKMHRMKGIEIKEVVKKKFLCGVLKDQCYMEKKKSLYIIDRKLI